MSSRTKQNHSEDTVSDPAVVGDDRTISGWFVFTIKNWLIMKHLVDAAFVLLSVKVFVCFFFSQQLWVNCTLGTLKPSVMVQL